MFCERRPRGVLGLNNAQTNIMLISKAPPKYTSDDWDFNNRLKFRISEDQQKLAERIINESERIMDETREMTNELKKEVDYQLRERSTEITFLVDELKKLRKTGVKEEDNLKTYKMRLENAIDYIKSKAIAVCQKCIMMRESRLGADLVEDEVDCQLQQEMKVIKGAQALIDKTYKENNEQIRRLKATLYLLDRDLSNKDKTLKIDETNLSLRKDQQQMSIYHGKTPITESNYSIQEWEDKTYKNLNDTAKELNCAGQLRSYIDLLMKQVNEDLNGQRDRTNEAFMNRICEMKFIKENLEATHKETMKCINGIRNNLEKLEKDLDAKQGYLALCQMRLANRAQRISFEMTADGVQVSLIKELSTLKDTINKLNQTIAENKASLRYLLHTQIMQEEEINIKMNSLKIDQNDCMMIRGGLHCPSF